MEAVRRAFGMAGGKQLRPCIPGRLRTQRWKRITLIGAVPMLAVSMACGKSDTGHENPTEPATSVTSAAAASATTPAAGIDAHNNADVWFVHHMIAHHRQEIEMSDILLAQRGVDPRVTDLAITIKTTRDLEIQRMQKWLSQWGVTQAPAHGSMVGQLTERELQALREARGADAGRLFLTQMIVHHEGAISLAQTEAEEGQYPPVVAMARQIASTQQQELDAMSGILASL